MAVVVLFERLGGPRDSGGKCRCARECGKAWLLLPVLALLLAVEAANAAAAMFAYAADRKSFIFFCCFVCFLFRLLSAYFIYLSFLFLQSKEYFV